MNDQPEHPFNTEVNSLHGCNCGEPDDATELRNEIHGLIAEHPDLTVYAIIGALRVVEHDLMDALVESNMENRDQTTS